jgi:phosphoribosylglycinamide formyltransferase-1
MEALIAAAAVVQYPAKITLVLSNRSEAAGLTRAQAAGVPGIVVDHRRFGGDREAFERALMSELEPRGIDLVCLAGFMRLFSPWFVQRWENRLLNIHPALLPSFKGLDTHARALAAGVKIHGATVHMVGMEMDSGPIIAQAALAVHDHDSVETLAARVLSLEHRLYPSALKLVAEGRVHVRDGRCIVDTAGVEGVLMVPASQ